MNGLIELPVFEVKVQRPSGGAVVTAMVVCDSIVRAARIAPEAVGAQHFGGVIGETWSVSRHRRGSLQIDAQSALEILDRYIGPTVELSIWSVSRQMEDDRWIAVSSLRRLVDAYAEDMVTLHAGGKVRVCRTSLVDALNALEQSK